MRLENRVAIVTGGGYGIGRAYSEGLAREGAKVVIADINDEGSMATQHAITSAGGEALAVHTDVSDQASTEAMAKAAIDRFGRIDILVNNAAYFATLPLQDFDEMDVATWDRVMAVNLKGPFLCCKAVVPQMRRQKYGKIVNISSSSILPGNPKRIHYVTSKAGIIGFSRSMARALGDDNICVNSVMPGSTASEGTIIAYGQEFFDRAVASKPLKRVQKPEDLVGTIIFLSSSDSDFITGAAINVDGGVYPY
ncbi:MAG: 3-oxoacyl-ACP reductase FabG [Dehalococcoidia bacterium]|nr:3-oxoacyl-ACP reductase FabG [Dehalococcoidia bacterium]